MRPRARILATGCAVETDRDAFRSMPEVDGLVPNLEKTRFETWAKPGARSAAPAPRLTASRRARAYVEVQNGCDHRCTFCVIPLGRGPSRSTPAEEAIEAVRARAGDGYREVVLTGVDLTSWGDDLETPIALGELVEAILRAVPDLPRLRLSSIDAAEIDPTLETLFLSEPRLMPHLHLSLQAGDDMILKRMKRRHSRDDALRLLSRLRRGRDIAVGADLIAGFPTETDAMFENTLRFVDECALDYLHVFPFSPRPGAPASRMPQVARNVVRTRAARLREAGRRRRTLRLAGRIGGVERILVETPQRGRTECYAEVDFGTPRPVREVGEIVALPICGSDGARLQAG